MENDLVTKQYLDERLTAMEERLTKNIRHTQAEMEDRFTERIRDMQTELLGALHDWQRPVEKRLGHVDELAQRLSWVEERLAALERKQLGGN